MSHWCRDIPRDEAVRAAEDGRSGPLPTLEECIERVTERRPVQPGGGGNVTGGLRTERVTLEVTHFGPESVAGWEWKYHIRPRHIFESVRVVKETHFDDLAQVAMQRDAAIREREELKARVDYLERDRKFWCLQSGAHEQATNVLRARVAELEAAAKLAPAANADGGSNHAAPAASGAAVLAEIAAAFGCDPDDDADLVEAARWLVRERDTAVAKAASGAAGTEVG